MTFPSVFPTKKNLFPRPIYAQVMFTTHLFHLETRLNLEKSFYITKNNFIFPTHLQGFQINSHVSKFVFMCPRS